MALFTFCLITCLILSAFAAAVSDESYCNVIEETSRFDCHPDPNATAVSCHHRGCCWLTPTTKGPPFCFFGSNSTHYIMGPIYETQTKQSTQATMVSGSPWPDDVKKLNIESFYETNSRLRIKITDAQEKRFEIPQQIFERPVDGKLGAATDPDYVVNFKENGFMIEVTRPDGGLLMNASALNFIYSDQFLQVSFFVPEQRLFGLGEHRGPLMRNLSDWDVLGIWNSDQHPIEPWNLYGSHPMYVMIGDHGLAHGVVFVNSNAMEVILQPAPAVTWRTIGGILDFYVLTGPTPSEVIKQYFDLIGRPTLPAYWSFGFHLSRWGYFTSNGTWNVVKKMREIGFPQETQWNDIDYMKDYLDFTYDPLRFDTLPEMVEDLHAHKQKYMMIVDPGICTTKNSSALELGNKMKIWMNTSDGVTPLQGKVWPGYTYFPDFTNPMATEFWTTELARYHSQVPFDGVWIDMNEPANFVVGSTSGCTDGPLDNPPYTPFLLNNDINQNTTCASAIQYAGVHYNVHNFYGLTEGMVTRRALEAILGKAHRSLIISRSSFMSHGRHASHWTGVYSGDNSATFEDMKFSIAATVNFNIFGVSMVGADICGFELNTTEELCTRWMQMGAFYTFMRNHNTVGAHPQDPTVFSTKAQSLQPRITGLTGLGFEFPEECFKTCQIDTQFMWGKAIMIAPVLTSGATEVDVYFPANHIWYDLESKRKVSSGSETLTIGAAIENLPIFGRSGQIVVSQKPELYLTDARINNFTLEAFLGDGHISKSGSGELYWDDGEKVLPHNEFSFVEFSYTLKSDREGFIVSKVINSGYQTIPIINTVLIIGSQTWETEQVYLIQDVQFRELEYSQQLNQLNIKNAAINANKNFTLCWI